MHRFIRSICLAVAVLSTCALHAEDWPQFRGPNCSGISTTTATLPCASGSATVMPFAFRLEKIKGVLLDVLCAAGTLWMGASLTGVTSTVMV